MNKWIVVASVWISALGCAGAFVYKMNRPPDTVRSTSPPSGHAVLRGRVDDESTEDATEPMLLEMPTVTIVGNLRGAAEMQGAGAVVAAPGVVIHGE